MPYGNAIGALDDIIAAMPDWTKLSGERKMAFRAEARRHPDIGRETRCAFPHR
jgi:hypothetical protein